MLNRTLAPLRLSGFNWANLSLLMVGLMWVLPFLHYRHESPLTTFDQEWWSALLGLGAMTLLVGGEFWRQPTVPRIAQLPAVLVIIVLVQVALNKVVYIEQGLLYILYMLFAALLMLLGARLRACFGIEKLAIVLAVFLVIGAELQAAIGLLQQYRWHTLIDSYIVLKVSFSVYGNMAQPNHFANYVALGLISLGLLYQQRTLKIGYVAALALPLLFVIALSGSRSTWLYFISMTILAWWWNRRDTTMRPLLHYSIAMLVGFGIMIFVVQLPFLAGADNNMDVMRRMFKDHSSGVVRLYLWKEASHIFLSAPLLGVGFGQYAWHHLQWVPILQATNIQGLYNHAHNLLLQFAAEAGLAGVVVLLGGLGLWLKGVYHARRSAAHWWGYAALAVLAIHSSLEYPLWYTYFVAIAAILLGLLDETHYNLELRMVGRLSVVAILLLGTISLFQVEKDYRVLKKTLAVRAAGNTPENYKQTVDGLISIQRGSLLYPYAELYLSTFRDVSADQYLKQKLLLNTKVIRFEPMPPVVYQQAFLLAQDGQLEAAKKVFEQGIWSYPMDGAAHQHLLNLSAQDPAHFAALLEFANQKEQEHARAIYHK
jgi:O-antigen ligase